MEPPTSARAQCAGARRGWRAGHARGRAAWAREGRRGRGEGERRTEGGARARDRPGMRAGSLCAREPAEHLLSLLLRALRGGAGMGERGHVVHGGLGAKRREAARLTSAVTPRLGGVGARQAYGAGGASQNLPRCCSAIAPAFCGSDLLTVLLTNGHGFKSTFEFISIHFAGEGCRNCT